MKLVQQNNRPIMGVSTSITPDRIKIRNDINGGSLNTVDSVIAQQVPRQSQIVKI